MEILWFIGIPISLILCFVVDAGYLFIKQSLVALIHKVPLSLSVPGPQDIKFMFIINISLVILLFLRNIYQYVFYGEREFNPIKRNCSTALSFDKQRAQFKPVPRQYLSYKPDGLTVGRRLGRYVRIPIGKDPEHILIYGSPGSKKSNLLKNGLINTLNRKSEFYGGVVIDVKPELSRSTVYEKRKDVRVLNPSIISKKRYGFNVYYGLSKDSSDDELITRFQMVSRTIIEDPGGDNSFFYRSAQNILTAFLVYGFRKGLSFGKAIRHVLDSSVKDLVSEILASKGMDTHPKIKRLVREYEGKDSDAFQDITMTLRQELAIFDLESVQYFFSAKNPHVASPQDLRKGTFLFIAIPDHLLTTYRAVFRLICEMCINYLMSEPEGSRKGKQPCWFLIDECGSIGKIPSLTDALARGRSKGILLSMIAQSYSQLISTYGQQGATTITDCAKINIILSCYDPDISQKLSKRCGTYRESKISTHSTPGILFSTTTGKNESDDIRPVMDISDIEGLEKNDKVLVFAKGDWFIVDKAPYYTIRKNKKLSDKLARMNAPFYPKDV